MTTQVISSNTAAGLTTAVTAAIVAGFFPVGGVFANPRANDGRRLCQLVNQVDNGVTAYLAVAGGDGSSFAANVQAALTADALWVPYGDPVVNSEEGNGQFFVTAFQKGFGT